LTRFFHFAHTLDRKLTRSCSKPSQQTLDNPTRSMLGNLSPSRPPSLDEDTHLRTLQTHNTHLLRLLDHNQTITRQLQTYRQQLQP
jgi:hypothetical protein